MAGQKISLLPPVATVLPTDMFIVARGGNTYKVYGSSFATTARIDALDGSIAAKASLTDLTLLTNRFDTLQASTNVTLSNFARNYATTASLNTILSRANGYTDSTILARINTLVAPYYIRKPTGVRRGDLLTWNGSLWVSAPSLPTTANYHYLDSTSVGGIMWYPAEVPPAGYLECNGASLSRTQYSELFAVIGTKFGAVDSEHFNVPDLRSQFIRGWDHGKGIDVGRTFGSIQLDSLSAHTHIIDTNIDTQVATFVNTYVDPQVGLSLTIPVSTSVGTTVSTLVTSTLAGEVLTNVFTTISSDVTTNASTTAAGIELLLSGIPLDMLTAMPEMSTAYFASSTPTTTKLDAYTTIHSVASSTAVSTPLLTATSIARSSANSVATSVASPYWSLTATSTAVSLATSNAVSMITSVAEFAGDTETRPRNMALLPCIKYTGFVNTTTLASVLSSYVPTPAQAVAGKVIGYNGTNWGAVDGLPLTARPKQILEWNNGWKPGDYPTGLNTWYSGTFDINQQTSSIEIQDIPAGTKRITIVMSQISLQGGSVIKLRLSSILGAVATNYKSNITAISTFGQQFLNTTDGFGVFANISHLSVEDIVPQTVTAENPDYTIILTKTEANNWVMSVTGSVEKWTVFGGGSISLPSDIGNITVFTNTGTFLDGMITLHYE